MSIEALLNNAISGLNASQASLRSTSENVANVNTPGYVRQETVLSPSALNGVGSGVTVEEVRRVLDTHFYQEAFYVAGEAAEAERLARTHDRLQAQFGSPEDNTAFTGRIEEVFSSITELAVTADSTPLRLQAITSLRSMSETFRSTMNEINNQRQAIDQEIVAAVAEANVLLNKIAKLNVEIERGAAAGQSVNGLLDQQDAALGELSRLMDVRVTRRDTGRADVATADGLQLVTLSAAQLTYAGVGAVSDATVFPPILIQMTHPQTNAPVGDPRNFSSEINTGELRAMLDLRDRILPDYSEQIAAVAAGVVDQLNAAHNDAATVPPPNTLQGRNTGLLASDAHNFSGRTSLALVDASGALVRRIDVDFDAGTYAVDGGGAVAFGATIGDLATALNTALGALGTASFAGGVLTLDAAASDHGFAVKQDASDPSARSGRGFAHFFGLNDLLSGSAPSHFQTGLTGADAHGFTAGQTIDFIVQGPKGEQFARTAAVPAGATFTDLLTAFNAPGTGIGEFFTLSLDADGALAATPNTGFGGYEILVAQDSTARGATGVGFTELFGLGPGPVAEQALDMRVRADIEADPRLLSGAQLELGPATALGDPVVTVGDNRGFLAIEARQNERIPFAAAGALPASVSTVSEYAIQTLNNFASRARAAQSASDNAEALRSDIEFRRETVQGVNLDEELATMLVYQQAYNASARLISAAQSLYDALLNAV